MSGEFADNKPVWIVGEDPSIDENVGIRKFACDTFVADHIDFYIVQKTSNIKVESLTVQYILS